MCQKTAVTTMLIQIVIFFNKLNIGVLLLLALGEGGGGEMQKCKINI